VTIYKRLVFPLARRLDPELCHEWSLRLLALAQRGWPGAWLLRAIAGSQLVQPVDAFGLSFPNVLGVAAGFDKDVRVATGLGYLGFGHVELGTLTPYPQSGQPRPRIFRLPPDHAVINRMGFPNEGVEAAVPRLKRLVQDKGQLIIGVSLGMQKETPLDKAVDDYLVVMRAVYPYADYLAVNISSPNTPGLRELQGGRYLAHLITRLRYANEALASQHHLNRRPLLLKIAPDLSWPELDEILAVALHGGVDGLIATNTTLERSGLVHPNQSQSGGLSGRPVAERSNKIIRYIRQQAGRRLPIIGVGGVFTAADVKAKLDAGAVLVQTYTGLVYEGPGMAGRILRVLASGG
jgi:dihydroorotate dehydrogenase